MIKINGEQREGFEGMTVGEMLAELGYKTAYIAIEMNGEILKRENYPSTELRDGDWLEVVNFVGGG
ncbi:MAG: sulfur carrier protein ThiS [Oscillospiraceae bacterium]|nr:sulfur carrier protein ThiS [Oscillospiraceae bacterium]